MVFSRIQNRFPTNLSDVRTTGRTIRLVLSIPQYAILFLFSFVVGLSIFVLSQNIELVRSTVFGGFMTPRQQISVLVHLYPFVGSAFSPVKGALILASASLFGVNFAMVVYHFVENKVQIQDGTGSVIGVIFGTLGAGCAACGSVLLTGLLSFVGATSVLTLLPFDGLSFSVLALIAFLFSIYWLADGMRGSTINGCPVDL